MAIRCILRITDRDIAYRQSEKGPPCPYRSVYELRACSTVNRLCSMAIEPTTTFYDLRTNIFWGPWNIFMVIERTLSKGIEHVLFIYTCSLRICHSCGKGLDA